MEERSTSAEFAVVVGGYSRNARPGMKTLRPECVGVLESTLIGFIPADV